jgi:hypothetical protein
VSQLHLPVRCNRPVLYIAGIRLCGGRITERLALAQLARAQSAELFEGAKIIQWHQAGWAATPVPRHTAAQSYRPKHDATTQAPSEYPDLGLFLMAGLWQDSLDLHSFALPVC